jgi:tRNA 2-selenouridine synthase SelU
MDVQEQEQEEMQARILAVRYEHGVDVQVKLDAVEKEWTESIQEENERYEKYMHDIMKLSADLSVEMERDLLVSHNIQVVCLRGKMLHAQLAVLKEAELNRVPRLRGKVGSN